MHRIIAGRASLCAKRLQPAPLSAGSPADLSIALRVGLDAPVLLTSAFLRATGEWAVPRKVLLISWIGGFPHSVGPMVRTRTAN